MFSRRRIHQLIEINTDPSDRLSRFIDITILSLIFLSVLAAMLESLHWFRGTYQLELQVFERMVVAIFSVEYILRIWACVENSEFSDPIRGRIRYALHPLPLIDLLAILPGLLPFLGTDLVAMRAIRLVRVFRVAKLTRYSTALQTLLSVISRRRGELAVTLSVGFVLIIASSTAMYAIESRAQPSVFSSIPATCWWAVTTLTTVGYGDMAPITPLGKLIASLISMMAIGLFALPAGILGSGLTEELALQRALLDSSACPTCGATLDEREEGQDQDQDQDRKNADSAL